MSITVQTRRIDDTFTGVRHDLRHGRHRLQTVVPTSLGIVSGRARIRMGEQFVDAGPGDLVVVDAPGDLDIKVHERVDARSNAHVFCDVDRACAQRISAAGAAPVVETRGRLLRCGAVPEVLASSEGRLLYVSATEGRLQESLRALSPADAVVDVLHPRAGLHAWWTFAPAAPGDPRWEPLAESRVAKLRAVLPADVAELVSTACRSSDDDVDDFVRWVTLDRAGLLSRAEELFAVRDGQLYRWTPSAEGAPLREAVAVVLPRTLPWANLPVESVEKVLAVILDNPFSFHSREESKQSVPSHPRRVAVRRLCVEPPVQLSPEFVARFGLEEVVSPTGGRMQGHGMQIALDAVGPALVYARVRLFGELEYGEWRCELLLERDECFFVRELIDYRD